MNDKKKMILFFALCAMFNMAASFAHPVTPTIFKELNLGDYMFGVSLGSMMIMSFLFSPVWGKLVGFVSSRVVMFICCAGYALGQLFFGLARSEAAFVFARMFAGVFNGGVFVAMLTYVINTTADPASRGKNLTTLATIQSVGGAFGYFIGGMLGQFSVRTAVYVQVVMLFLSGALLSFTSESDSTTPLSELKLARVVREANPFAVFLASRGFMTALLAVLFAMCTLQNMGFTAFDQSFNYFIKDQLSFPPSYNGMIKGVMGLITLVANSTICIFIINRTNVRRSVIGVLGLGALFYTGVLTIGSTVPFLASSIIFYALNSVSIPLLQSLVAEKARGEQSNLVMGFYNSMKSLGGIFGAFISGALYTVIPRLPFAFGVLAFTLATCLSVFYYTKTKSEVGVK